MSDPRTILCIASYEKGHEFLRQAKRSGWRVLLLTSLSLKDKANWPTESIDDIFYMPDVDKKWNVFDTIKAVSHLARTEDLSRIVPMDDFDLELVANLREHLRVPGMGDTTTRYFRDKLAMRMKAREEGVPVPDFVHVLNDAKVRAFTESVPGPWVLKPRTLAGAIGIRRIPDTATLYAELDTLGDERSFFLLEKYVPGDIFHVDSIVNDSRVLFASASAYGRPPLDVSHDGDVFTSRLLPRGEPLERKLLETNRAILKAMGLRRGVSHTELIVGRDGTVYFLETSARVGGAHIAESRRGGARAQSLGRVGEARARRERRHLYAPGDARRICRALGIARQTGAPRHELLRRRRDRVADRQAVPRRVRGALAEPRARQHAHRRLRGASSSRVSGRRAAEASSDRLKSL